jgi:hypothetical protein
MWLTKSQAKKCQRAHLDRARTPIPSRMVSNGEYMPVLQTVDRNSEDASDRLSAIRDDYQVFQEEEGSARSNASYG